MLVIPTMFDAVNTGMALFFTFPEIPESREFLNPRELAPNYYLNFMRLFLAVFILCDLYYREC